MLSFQQQQRLYNIVNRVQQPLLFLLVLAAASSLPTTMSLAATAAVATTTPRHIVVVGGGIQGVSVAYQLAIKTATSKIKPVITVLEAVRPASAASGKGGGFMARSWGEGSPTQSLHEQAFDMYEDLAVELGCESYRKLPVLSVSPGYQGLKAAAKNPDLREIIPGWLDGAVGRVSCMVSLVLFGAKITAVHLLLCIQSFRVAVTNPCCMHLCTIQIQRDTEKIQPK